MRAWFFDLHSGLFFGAGDYDTGVVGFRFSIVALDGRVLSDEEATAADRCDLRRVVGRSMMR